MTAQITTLTIKDGAGIDRTVQAVDLSGTGAGPWSFLHGLVDADGAAVTATNPLPVAGGAATGTVPTQPPILTSGIDPAGLKRTLRTDANGVTAVQNAPIRIRDNFEAATLSGWTVTADADDIVQLDGNALGAAYLVISKDPASAGTDTVVESTVPFGAPFRAGFGVSTSQRVLGQMAAVEVVSTDAPIAPVADGAIASISQVASALTVTTSAAHGLRPGDRVSIDGVTANNALNYPQLVVATVPSTTQFTATAHPGATIPSATAGPYTSGTVRRYDHVGRAQDGTAMIFEGAVSGATFAARGGGATAKVSGTANGNQSTTISSSASTQLLASTALYAFAPTSQFELFHQLELLEWIDNTIDTAISNFTPRFKSSQVVPDPNKTYKLRFRATNALSLARPVAAIVSAAKTGTTTATIVTATAHGLATGELVTLYGIRDGVNFPNLATATVVASVVNATTFTIVIGGAVTATSYGGVVCRSAGGQVQAGIAASVVQSAATTAAGVLTLVGSSNWTGPSIGDYVNLYGVRAATDGASLGLDGAYRVRDGVGTTSLVLEPIGSTAVVASLASTNCGGAVIKRTDLRLHFVRVAEVTRIVTESAGGISRNDAAVGSPVMITGGGVVVQGSQVDQSTSNANGIPAMVQTLSALPTAGTTGRRSSIQGDLAARPVVRPLGMPQANGYGRQVLTSTTETTLLSATASQRWELDNVVIANRDGVAHTVDIRDASAGTVRWSAIVAGGATLHLPLRGAPATAVNAAVTATLRETAATGVEVSVNAYATTA